MPLATTGALSDVIPTPLYAGWEVPTTVLEATGRLGGMVGVRRLRRDGDELISVSQPDTLRLPLGEALTGVCLTSMRSVVATLDEERLHPRERAMMADAGADLLVAVPVVPEPDGPAVGVVVGLRRTEGQAAGVEDTRLAISLLSEHLAVSLRHHEALGRLRAMAERAAQLQGEAEGILHGMRAPALVLAADNRLHDANRAAEVLLGFHVPRARGKVITEVVEEPSLQRVLAESGEALTGRPPEIKLRRPDEVVYEVRIAPIYDARGELCWRVVVLNDITTVRQADVLKSEFVSVVSHELRTPLTSIKAFTSTLLHSPEASADDQQEWLRIIDHECDRLTGLVNDLLVISRVDSGKTISLSWGQVNIAALIKSILAALKPTAHRHQLVYVGPEELLIVADRERLLQVFDNLISNAVKYSPRGGLVEVSAEETDDDVRVLVRDQGVGIRPEHLNMVFERFYQVDGSSTRRVGGSGLGLYLSRYLVEAHGGSVWAESEHGKGSTFVVVLPKRPPVGLQ